MSTVGIYDFDFFTYTHVLPNLECAKLCSYYRIKNDIAVFTPEFNPNPYAHYIVRKDYDDGNFFFLKENCEYGGHAFSGELYSPMPEEIEISKPNMEIYLPHYKRFSENKIECDNFKAILNGTNIRISLDNETIWNDFYKSMTSKSQTGSVILHDYNLSKIKDAADVILDLSKHTTQSGKIMYRKVGNKFPIQVESSSELLRWMNIFPHQTSFYFQYNGLIEDEVLKEVIKKNPNIIKTLNYNIATEWFSTNQFFNEILPKIFNQIIFLRRNKLKISLLTIDKKIKYDQMILDWIVLLDSYVKGQYKETQVNCLFRHIDSKPFRFHFRKLSIERIREMFNAVRIENYDLFKKFYQDDRMNS